jgi:hypothetical protein
LQVLDAAGAECSTTIARVATEQTGSLRSAVVLHGHATSAGGAHLLDLALRMHFFAGSPVVRFELTCHNPRRAHHQGGLWDLGDPGSVLVRDLSFVVAWDAANGPRSLGCSPELHSALSPCETPLEIFQASSGGENWGSSNHVNRHRIVPNPFKGYRLTCRSKQETGLRATPVIALETGNGRSLAAVIRHFWQNFPMAMEVSDEAMRLRLFPGQFGDLHEIQGGEQKTHEFHVAFGPDPVTSVPLDWCRAPLVAAAAPEWYCGASVVPYLLTGQDHDVRYRSLVNAALDGEDTFEMKRETVDEYGWRHFGDIYGDHEAVRCPGLVSHYNNQYDPIAGFAYQFFCTGDPRWWSQMCELAAHVVDIDIYHTSQDKAAYNHGLFWHTYHYVDADTATHRSYPRAAVSEVRGGGPSCEQNYTTGLMLHYFLTGDPRSRDAVIGLGRFVVDMDDGRTTPLAWLDRGYTGFASSSGSPDYHGPGRGPANSLNALLDAYRLTHDGSFMDKAEQLIRRCIHPRDAIADRRLDEPERRWFYVMFLQSLGRYLDYKAELDLLDARYSYARESLLHYARWMAAHEAPYLDKPHLLDHPTETWAAQDMRKCEVFDFAAQHASPAERSRFLERADFFFNYSTSTLAAMPTRTLARPVVIMLSHGFMHAYFKRFSETAAAPPRDVPADFGEPQVFVPQKSRAKKKLIVLAALAASLASAGLTLLLG